MSKTTTYIIMADGEGKRWNNYQGIEKHFAEVKGEPIIERTIRLVKKLDPSAKIIVTSHNPKYEFEGVRRYEPLNNELEIDRFTFELIDKGVCFLYGDTYYTKKALRKIVKKSNDSLLFFGTLEKIVALKVNNKKEMITHIQQVRQLYLEGKISKCIGWQLYQSFEGLSFKKIQIKDHFVLFEDKTHDFNTPQDYKSFIRTYFK